MQSAHIRAHTRGARRNHTHASHRCGKQRGNHTDTPTQSAVTDRAPASGQEGMFAGKGIGIWLHHAKRRKHRPTMLAIATVQSTAFAGSFMVSNAQRTSHTHALAPPALACVSHERASARRADLCSMRARARAPATELRPMHARVQCFPRHARCPHVHRTAADARARVQCFPRHARRPHVHPHRELLRSSPT